MEDEVLGRPCRITFDSGAIAGVVVVYCEIALAAI